LYGEISMEKEGVHVPVGSESDKSIIDRIQAGDVDAFSLLLDRYQGKVYSVVAKHVPEGRAAEVTHDVFVDVFKSLAKFRGDCSFGTWLCRISLRRSYDFWRRHGREYDTVSIDDITEEQQIWLDMASMAVSERERESSASRKEASDVLKMVMESIDPEDRMIVSLLYMEEQPVREVAASLGWSEIRVKVRAFRARKKLKKQIDLLIGGGA